MLARAVESMPEVEPGELWFEPKWDGFRAVVFRDGPSVEIGSRNERPLTRYFPELAGPLRARLPLQGAPEVEVGYDAVGSGRFRYNARMLRRRPDRSAGSCIYEQIARTSPVELAEVFATDGVRDVSGSLAYTTGEGDGS